MFRRLVQSDPAVIPVLIRFEGREIAAHAGESLAAALLAAGEQVFRISPVSKAPRGPFCMMGACFDCMVEIDGLPGQQACMTAVRAGMDVRRDRIAEAAE
ncbi:MAG: (2Fe-2S)-binding protein [Oricola sp.]